MNQSRNRKRAGSIIIVLNIVLLDSCAAKAQSTITATPQEITVPSSPAIPGNRISAGLNLGDPLGATMKYRIGAANAVDVSFGPDYFGSPRLQIDYVWLFDIFHSNIVKEYAGPGLAVACAKGVRMFFSREPHHESFADQEDNGFGIGGRTIFGFDITPRSSRIAYFVEAGPLVGINHIFDLDLDGAIGFRYGL